jgi:poly-gamma-glutamate synthesis protein (capsule biosynthesis protein)
MPPTRLWIDPDLPQPFQQETLPDGIVQATSPDQADLKLAVSDTLPISYWIYALVAPFPTIPNGVTSVELRQAWQGASPATFPGLPLLLSDHTYQVLSVWWGAPTEKAVKVLPEDQLVDYAWNNRPAWAIIPFENLQARWKVLEIDSLSPVRKDFVPDSYALSLPVSLLGQPALPNIKDELAALFPASNRDPGKLTTLILTGVTAMVRGTALTMEQRGITYPAQDIGPWLREADILHISNEIPFYDQCPFPELYPAELRFCSNPSYVGLLEDIGTDIVELSGDHFGDYGPEGMAQTLKIYKDRGWPYYGGGANLAEGRQPLLLEHNGNRLAILGCNAKGVTYYAPAGVDKPGAAACDFEQLKKDIAGLKEQGYLVIVTFQDEEYYSYKAQPKLISDFHAVAEAGADIVSGSQAHQPHGMEFLKNSFIHYGLGNLFFDQYRFFPGPELDNAFIDRHIFYDGKYISTELLTIHFIDLARSRPMTPAEQARFLKTIFTASGW